MPLKEPSLLASEASGVSSDQCCFVVGKGRNGAITIIRVLMESATEVKADL